MIFPLIEAEAGSGGTGLGVALVLGVAFGFALERAGLGSARKLAGQFYGRDLTVLKVMFSAIVTAALGVFWLSRLGLLDATRVYVPPTYLLPQAVGGAVFGVGLVAAGLCPG
ncbi:MAG TPA: YeeE/YedE thiosulfate transporter family protein, partial [Longimicrobium sp.]|nr:YeeE/YedE thiosulfate transporter family protein [Longimicrobium sp.]